MKNFLHLLLILLMFFKVVSTYAGEFQIQTKLSLQEQYNYKQSIDSLYKNFEYNLTELNDSKQVNILKKLIVKVNILKNSNTTNDKNRYMYSYLLFLLNEKLTNLKESQKLRSDIINNDSNLEKTKYITKIYEVEFLSDDKGLIYIRSSGDNVKGRFGDGEKNIWYLGSSDYRRGIQQSLGYYLSSGKNIYVYIPWHIEKKDIKSEGVYKIEGADINTFKVIENKFSLDGSCGNSLNSFAKDNNNVYYLDMIIQDANAKTFESLWGGYSKDDKYYYYNQYKFDSVDINTFKILDKGYSKDKNYVYYGNNILEGADANSFEVEMYCKAKDKNHSYEYGKLVK